MRYVSPREARTVCRRARRPSALLVLALGLQEHGRRGRRCGPSSRSRPAWAAPCAWSCGFRPTGPPAASPPPRLSPTLLPTRPEAAGWCLPSCGRSARRQGRGVWSCSLPRPAASTVARRARSSAPRDPVSSHRRAPPSAPRCATLARRSGRASCSSPSPRRREPLTRRSQSPTQRCTAADATSCSSATGPRPPSRSPRPQSLPTTSDAPHAWARVSRLTSRSPGTGTTAATAAAPSARTTCAGAAGCPSLRGPRRRSASAGGASPNCGARSSRTGPPSASVARTTSSRGTCSRTSRSSTTPSPPRRAASAGRRSSSQSRCPSRLVPSPPSTRSTPCASTDGSASRGSSSRTRCST